jgi:hypothetical protein
MQNVFDQRRLAGTRDAGHRDEQPEGNLDIEVSKVVLARALDTDRLAIVGDAPLFGRRDRHLTAQILPGDRRFVARDLVHGSERNDLAAMLAGAGAKIDDVVRRAHRLFIVLDDNHGVAEIAKLLERGEQPRVVALV